MQTLILCNHIQKSLSPLCENSPTAALKILDKSLLEIYLETLSQQGFSEFNVVAPKRVGEILGITQKLKNRFDITLTSSALSDVEIIRHAWLGDDVLVCECDRNHLGDVQKLAKTHKMLNSQLTFLTNSTEKSPFLLSQTLSTDFSHNGVYILSKELVATIPLETKIREISELALNTPNTYLCPQNFQGFQIKTPHDFVKANKIALENVQNSPDKFFQTSDGFVNKSGRNLHGVTVIPPVFVAKNATVGSGTVLDSGTIIGENASVGEKAYLKNTFVGEGSLVGDRTSLDETVLEKGVTLQKGVCCEKMTFIGSKTFVGEDTLVKSGVKILAGKKISPCQTVCDDVNFKNDGEIHFDDNGEISDFSVKITPRLSAEIGCAVASALELDQSVCLAFHGKPHAKILANALSSGLNFCGIDAWLLPDATLGELVFAMSKTNSTVGVEISTDFKSSVRVISSGGTPLTDELERKIEDNLNFGIFRQIKQQTGELSNGQAFQKMYLNFLESLLPAQFSKLNVRVKTSDKSLADACDKIFPMRNDVNGETVTFHLNPTGEGISAYTEKSGYVFRDKLTLAVINSKLAVGQTLPLSETFPEIAEKLAEGTNGEILRYAQNIGETPRKMLSKNENLFLCDPLTLCVEIVAVMQREKLSLKGLVVALPKFYVTKRFVCVDCEKIKRLPRKISSVDNNSHAVLKPVKNGKGVNVYVDAEKMEIATSMCDEIEMMLKKIDTE